MTPSLVSCVKKGFVVAIVKVGNHDGPTEAPAKGVGYKFGLYRCGRVRVRNRIEG